jgi:hypothetical protein
VSAVLIFEFSCFHIKRETGIEKNLFFISHYWYGAQGARVESFSNTVADEQI